MNAIQEFRNWDVEDDDDKATQTESSSWQYDNGDKVPIGLRIGVVFNRGLVLDPGINPHKPG